MTESSPRVGIPRQFFFDWLQPGVRDAVENAVTKLAENGMTIVEAPWPDAAAARAAAFLINRVETAAVHERVAVEEPERFSRYGAELRVRIAAGRTVSATLYTRALRARRIVKDSIARLFRDHHLDVVLAPTLPTTAIPADRLVIEGTGLDESVGAGWTRLTMPFNATGQPVLALPCGLDPLGLPVGLQLAGRPGDEARLFQVARAAERILDFHRGHPPLLHALAPVSLTEDAP